ncbi:vacuolar protein sorting-associated protein 45 homolog [Quercus robur]|uniref:vacuolar protein sorting-associated protein 45 homolog n=1 Tax=Quercus robur TaxID=38942 RepID=UPI002162E836|nr:vacuolar protein sorting-associated protein 45 homolog [Quercus robur]
MVVVRLQKLAVTNLLNNESSSDIDRLRLVMLYALRYKKENPVQLMQLFNKLASQSAKYKPGLVQFILKQAGVDKRTGDLLDSHTTTHPNQIYNFDK